MHRDRPIVASELDAEYRERPLRMVTGCVPLSDGGLARGEEPGEQHRGLDLCARDRRRELNAPQRRAPNDDRWAVVVGAQVGAHTGQRVNGPPHRASAQGPVAGDDAVERVSGEHTA